MGNREWPRFWIAAPNSRLGQAVMRQEAADKNPMMVAIVLLADQAASQRLSEAIKRHLEEIEGGSE